MQFDFSKFQKAVTRIYDKSPYTLGEVLFVFKEYFKAYEEFIGRAHPRISVTQIRNIIEKMPYIAHTGGNRGKEQTPLFEVHPEDCKPDSIGYNSPEV